MPSRDLHLLMNKTSAIIAGVAVLTVVFLVLPNIPAYTQRGDHCDFTGSTKTWISLPFGIRINEHYEKSSLEEFISKKYPSELQHQWISYVGTGKNIFGKSLSFGHGRPNALLTFNRTYLDAFVNGMPDEQVKDLYDTLVRNDRAEIKDRIGRLLGQGMELLFGNEEDSSISLPLEVQK